MSISQRLVERVLAERIRRFVGREAERNLFRSALAERELPFYLLYVYGPGGIGKTNLLREFGRLSAEADTPYSYLDARDVEPVPDAFAGALSRSMGLASNQSAIDAISSRGRRHVLLIDTYEALALLDGWLREVFFPQFPEDTLIVLADRQAPSPAWRADPGWQTFLRTLPLRNLTPREGRDYLFHRGVPPEQHEAVLDFTHSHPLALSLVADLFDQRPGFQFKPEAAPDVVKQLLAQLVQKVPSPAHRAALEACSLVRLTTEPLLAAMLCTGDAHELFDWLRDLSFIESGPLGLFPHDLAREALAADLRWRNPDWYAELHRRARDYYSTRLQQAHGREQQLVIFDYVFLHRENSVVRPFFEWQENGATLPDSMRPGEARDLIGMVARHEGDESARIAARWFERQPEGVLVFRGPEQRPAGFMAIVALHRATPEDLAADPAASQAWEYMRSRVPLRPGEGATLFRFWMAADSYQSVSSVQSLIFVNAARHYLVAPALAFTFFPCADPGFWSSAFAYVDLERVVKADFSVGGRTYGMYGHDWRAVPPAAWLALLGEREISAQSSESPQPQAAPLVLVLSRPDFDSAVREALRDLPHLDVLRANPLLRSRIVVERVGAASALGERAAALQTLVTEAAESLRSSPRQEKSYQALYHTYIHPAPTQEAASEMLDLPFSTFRRHLKAGMIRVTEMLWQLEIGAG
jgi:hypothetical protein